MGREGKYLNKIKTMYDKPLATQYHTQWWKSKSFSSKISNKTGMSTLTSLIQHSTEVLARAIWQEKKIKGILIRNEEVKL